MPKESVSTWEKLVEMFKSKWFYRQLLFTILGLLVLLFLILMWLQSYTHHGQKLTLPDYVGMNIKDARQDAERKTFEIIVDDSIHFVGKPGGEILAQNPLGNSKVKEGRKIYATISKHQPDLILSGNLPVLYGRNYENKKEELKVGFELDLEIIGYKFDPGPPDHILEVFYKGDPFINAKGRNNNLEIEKGSTLQVVLSQATGGEVSIPNVVCEDLDQARFIIESRRLSITEVVVLDGSSDSDVQYVARQSPEFDPERKLIMGEGMTLYVQAERPDGCPGER